MTPAELDAIEARSHISRACTAQLTDDTASADDVPALIARVRELEGAFDAGREDERAAVVAWLRSSANDWRCRGAREWAFQIECEDHLEHGDPEDDSPEDDSPEEAARQRGDDERHEARDEAEADMSRAEAFADSDYSTPEDPK